MTLEQYCECAKGEVMWCPVHGRGDDPRVAHRLQELLAELQQVRDEQEACIAGYEERCIELYAGRNSWRRVAERLEREKGELRAQCNRVLEQLGTARRDYEVMNNFRRGAEKERDGLRTENKRLRQASMDYQVAISLLEWALNSIDVLNEGPVTVAEYDEDAALYMQAQAIVSEGKAMRKPTAQETGQGDECPRQSSAFRGSKQECRESGRCVCDEPEWRTHDSHEPPADLAAAQLVEVEGGSSDGVPVYFGPMPVCDVNWERVARYRPALSADGDWLCSGEGLEPWAKYVCTDYNGAVFQMTGIPEFKPKIGCWEGNFRLADSAPDSHRRPGPASESLMEVSLDH